MAMRSKRWIVTGLVTVVVLVAGLSAYGLYRYQIKKKTEAASQAMLEKNFRELQEQSIAIGHEKEYIAMTKKQMAGRKAELEKEIAQLKELLTYLEK
jgi:hypothetical protein